MARLLDVVALIILVVAIGMLMTGVYVMGNRDDVLALFCLVAGVVLLRSAVDLLRPRSAG